MIFLEGGGGWCYKKVLVEKGYPSSVLKNIYKFILKLGETREISVYPLKLNFGNIFISITIHTWVKIYMTKDHKVYV